MMSGILQAVRYLQNFGKIAFESKFGRDYLKTLTAKQRKAFEELSSKQPAVMRQRVRDKAGSLLTGMALVSAPLYNDSDDAPPAEKKVGTKGGRGKGEAEVTARRAKAKNKTFKEAFADARSAGKKTFTFKGERYTTEVAEGKKEKVPTTSKTKAKNKVLSKTDAGTATSYNSKGGVIQARAGASVPPNRMSRK